MASAAEPPRERPSRGVDPALFSQLQSRTGTAAGLSRGQPRSTAATSTGPLTSAAEPPSSRRSRDADLALFATTRHPSGAAGINDRDSDPDAHSLDHALQTAPSSGRNPGRPRQLTDVDLLEPTMGNRRDPRRPALPTGPNPDDPVENAATWMVDGNYDSILRGNPPAVPAGGDPLTAGKSFMCAAASILLAQHAELIAPYNKSPYSGSAGGNTSLAVAWFKGLHAALLAALGHGRSFVPETFLLHNLAGRNPEPVLFAACYAALATAATAAMSGRPFSGGDRDSSSRPVGRGPTVHMTDDEKGIIVAQHVKALPPGMQDLAPIISATVDRVSVEQGEQPLDKSLSYLRACGGKIAAVTAPMNTLVDRDGVLVLGEQKFNASQHLCLQQQAIRLAMYTKTAAGTMNLDDPKTCKLLQALTSRDFLNTAVFGLSRFIPSSFHPSPSVAATFGEAENGILLGQHNKQFGLDATKAYWALGVALTVLLIADLPTLDIGFQVAVQWFIDSGHVNEAKEVPFWWVAKVLGKTFQRAQSLRRMASSHGYDVDPISRTMMYSYTDSDDIRDDKRKIEAYDSQRLEMEMWTIERRMHQSSAGSRSTTGRNSKNVSWEPDATSTDKTPTRGKTTGSTSTGKKEKRSTKAAASTRGGGSGSNSGNGQDSTRPPAQKKTKRSGSSTAADRVRRISLPKWIRTYGTRTVDGEDVKICFFEWNKEAGCSKTNCTMSHNHSPADYGNKRFHALTSSQQDMIVAGCE